MESAFLQPKFTNILVANAWREDYAMAYGGDTKTEMRDHEREFIETYSTEKRIWNKILQALVFRKHLYLTPIDNFVIDDLRDQDVVEWADPLHQFDCTSQEFLEKGLVPAVVEYLNAQSDSSVKPTADEIRELLEIDFIEKFEKFRDENLHLDTLSLISQLDDVQVDLDDEAEKQFEEIRQEREALEDRFFDIYAALREIWQWHIHSSELNAPVMWNVDPTVTYEKSSLDLDKKESYTIANIYFENLDSIEVHSISDALELRQSKYIEDFRKEVKDAITGIKKNDMSVDEIESRIESANQSLGKIDRARKTGSLCTLAPALAPPEPFSNILTPIGIGSIAYSKYKQQQYSWAFVSRQV